jgi:hypothetical protein
MQRGVMEVKNLDAWVGEVLEQAGNGFPTIKLPGRR